MTLTTSSRPIAEGCSRHLRRSVRCPRIPTRPSGTTYGHSSSVITMVQPRVPTAPFGSPGRIPATAHRVRPSMRSGTVAPSPTSTTPVLRASGTRTFSRLTSFREMAAQCYSGNKPPNRSACRSAVGAAATHHPILWRCSPTSKTSDSAPAAHGDPAGPTRPATASKFLRVRGEVRAVEHATRGGRSSRGRGRCSTRSRCRHEARGDGRGSAVA
jgi:hypothetical protein